MHRAQVMSSRQLAGRVTRWHTWPMIRKPSVMEHAGRVATLYVELFGLPRAEVLLYCLHHDHGEFTAGDTPFSAKSLVPGLREGLNVAEEIGRDRLGIHLPDISSREFLMFKVCDLLEMFETGVVEWNMGNRYAGCVIVDCVDAALATAEALDEKVEENDDSAGEGPAPDHRLTVVNWVHSNGYKGVHAYDVT